MPPDCAGQRVASQIDVLGFDLLIGGSFCGCVVRSDSWRSPRGGRCLHRLATAQPDRAAPGVARCNPTALLATDVAGRVVSNACSLADGLSDEQQGAAAPEQAMIRPADVTVVGNGSPAGMSREWAVACLQSARGTNACPRTAGRAVCGQASHTRFRGRAGQLSSVYDCGEVRGSVRVPGAELPLLPLWMCHGGAEDRPHARVLVGSSLRGERGSLPAFR